MKIIQATVQDAPVIHDIMIQAFLKYQNENPPSSALDETVQTLSEGLQNGEQAIICYVEDQPAGMVRFRMEENSMYFFRLSVIPERHGQGIAKKILNYLEDLAKQQNKHELLCKVRIDVPENIHLYQSIGYYIYEETIVKRADGASVPDVVMRKLLR
ncbi:GNAT family N-acetyltransferase [Sporosarcina cascadiensis]|uniref:GNAT family N-acetyltransferase n=1 Tax=Sporosarcina cascadiensis TaxID=2660747 RepID=UPI00129A6E1D|nr:GNAT family N-acetyltransferase [Sporosarcina cascadiensis]